MNFKLLLIYVSLMAIGAAQQNPPPPPTLDPWPLNQPVCSCGARPCSTLVERWDLTGPEVHIYHSEFIGGTNDWRLDADCINALPHGTWSAEDNSNISSARVSGSTTGQVVIKVTHQAGACQACAQSNTFRAVTRPIYWIRIDVDPPAMGTIAPKMTEQFTLCNGADNALDKPTSIKEDGTIFLPNFGAGGGTVGVGLGVTTGTQISQHTDTWIAADRKHDVKTGLQEYLILEGQINVDVSADGWIAAVVWNTGSISGSVYNPDHQTKLEWRCKCDGGPTCSGSPSAGSPGGGTTGGGYSGPPGGTTPSNPGGTTTGGSRTTGNEGAYSSGEAPTTRPVNPGGGEGH